MTVTIKYSKHSLCFKDFSSTAVTEMEANDASIVLKVSVQKCEKILNKKS